MMTRKEMMKAKEVMPNLDLDKYYYGDVREAIGNLLMISDYLPEGLREQYERCITVIKENTRILERKYREIEQQIND